MIAINLTSQKNDFLFVKVEEEEKKRKEEEKKKRRRRRRIK